MIIAVVAIALSVAIGVLVTIIFELFGNPFDRIKIRNIAEQYLVENYSEMNPSIVDIDYDAKYIGYQVEIHLEKTGKTF